VLGGVFQKRFMPIPRQVKESLGSGCLGQFYLVDGYVKWWRDDEYYRAASWRGTREFEGGAMINQAIQRSSATAWPVTLA
jgi:predicted dehydrogenase